MGASLLLNILCSALLVASRVQAEEAVSSGHSVSETPEAAEASVDYGEFYEDYKMEWIDENENATHGDGSDDPSRGESLRFEDFCWFSCICFDRTQVGCIAA